MNPVQTRYPHSELKQYAVRLMTSAGLAEERAEVVAEVLLEGDLMGHTTHGLQMLVPYLKSMESGGMALEGEPEVVMDQGPNLTWDGGYLPGPWLVVRAMETMESRVEEFGVATAVIRRSHHIACLQAYLLRATEKNRLMILTCSDPSSRAVAPHGGLEPLYTPNPFAVGIPTRRHPILIDVSASITTNGMSMRLHKEGRRLPGRWLKSAKGEATDDPGVLFEEPPGSILPVGGMEYGHKGFALGLWIEAMTSALGGYGRSKSPDQWGASVFMQLIDPKAFGGVESFLAETGWLADAARANPVAPGDPPVRLPGDAAMAKRERQLEHGVQLHPGILPALRKWSQKWGAPEPRSMD